MAGFYLISEENPQVRDVRVAHAKSKISPVPCSWRSEVRGKVEIVFATLPHTPFSRHEDANGTVTLVLGRPVDDQGAIEAKEMAELVRRGCVPWLSGLFAWFSLGPDGSVRIGCNPFSLIPVFYSEKEGRVEVTSSPSAIHSQAGFLHELDAIGLARYLLGNGSSGERSLDGGIRRLKNCHELLIRGTGGISVPGAAGFSAMGEAPPGNFEESCREANELLGSACRRHRQEGDADLFLSGGLDSRLVLAHLVSQGVSPRCLSRGYPGDDEVIFARKSARATGCEWMLVRDDFSRALEAARAEVDLLSLHGGFSTSLTMADSFAPMARSAQTFNGFFMDAIFNPFSGVADEWKPRRFEDEFRRKMNLFGIPPGKLKALLIDPVHREAVDEAIAEMRKEWEGLSDDPRIRIWQMLHRFRTNHHIGGIVWKNSFSSWPVFPSLDVPLLRRLVDFPVEHFRHRKLEREMLVRMSPVLARIPLDGNSRNPMPILDTPGARWGRRARKLRAKFFPRTASDDNRRYHRVLNMNAEAWLEIRKEADRQRGGLEELFDAKKLAVYLPRSHKPVPLEKNNAVSEHAGRRMLAGLAIYLGKKGA